MKDEIRSEEKRTEQKTSYWPSKGLFGETDRESGEYRFHKTGETAQVYSNAHYIPADETTVPPRFYRPAGKNDEKNNSSAEEQKQKARMKKFSAGFFAILFLCILCSLVGGAVGSLLTSAYYHAGEVSANMNAMEDNQMPLPQYEKIVAEEQLPEMVSPEPATVLDAPVLSAAEIYLKACGEVMSITTETVTIDADGYQIPSAVNGSGFVVTSDGYILTNYHVVEKAYRNNFPVTVTDFNGNIYNGKVAGVREEADLAAVKIEAEGLIPAKFGDSSRVRVGDEVFAVGNPFGILEFTMTIGHVSALDRTVATNEERGAASMFQIDAAVYAGNSGGPVYNSFGEVIGIVTAKIDTDGLQGIGFALPINDVADIVDALSNGSYVPVERAELSIDFDDQYNSVYSRYYKLPEGAFVRSVLPGGCADKAGIREGDIIVQIGDYGVYSPEDAVAAVSGFFAGDMADVVLFREGEQYETSITFDKAPY